MIGTPTGFRKTFLTKFNTTVVRVNTIVEFHASQVMLIAALKMHNLTKNILPKHIEYGQNVPAITNIFQHHVLTIGSFAGFDYIPMIFQANAHDNFTANIFTSFQS